MREVQSNSVAESVLLIPCLVCRSEAVVTDLYDGRLCPVCTDLHGLLRPEETLPTYWVQ